MPTDRQMELAKDRITSFENNPRPGWFTGFTRAEVSVSLKIHIADPKTINQRDTFLCGSAAFLNVLAGDQPEKYVKLVTELFDDGRSYIYESTQMQSGIWIKPDDHLKNYRPNKRDMDSADWIAMASLRDSSNWFLDYETMSDSAWAGGTYPSDMANWLRKFGGYDLIIDKTNPWFGKEDNLHEANRYYLDKFRLFLNVNSAMFNDVTSTWSLSANHWAILDSPITIGRNKIQMSAYTWGSRYPNKVIWRQSFLDHYYGFIAVKY